ncbi:5-methyltetrahydropteroyltriglutamate--homocysteine S-methyltransferase [Roseomonas sp. BN140053]|uniref:5-methyltetrahydropteroyltriglutamate-- homocysteine S-methyltransferase n=1 Tax=Roseomonas sp. BN140053 TaxID=3391898 RepID=UPI0039EA7672
MASQTSPARGPMPRADTVGSLLRPAVLHQARHRFAAGEIDAAALRQVEDAAIREVVRLQEEVGLPVVTDGEFRRENWWIDFVSRLRGVEIRDGASPSAGSGPATDEHGHDHDHGHDHGHAQGYVPKQVLTVSRIGADGPVTVADYAFLAAATDRLAKVTLPSPTRLHFHGGRGAVSRDAYPDIEEFFAEVAALYRREIAALEAAGCRYIQIDDPILAYFLSPRMRDGVRAEGDDPDARLRRYVRLVNDCIRDRAPDTRVGIHICRGNARSLALSEGPYDGLAEACFGELAADRFLLEYDDPRSGGFEPLRLIPRGKEVVLGLVTTKHPGLESKDALKRRIDEAARFLDPEQMAISPQCGFASVVEGNAIGPADQLAKLRLVVETAREVWGG